MKTILYENFKNDLDFIDIYKKYNKGKTKGFKELLKENIDFFIDNFDVYLDKPYMDVSWFKVKNKIIDIDLLYNVFKERLTT